MKLLIINKTETVSLAAALQDSFIIEQAYTIPHAAERIALYYYDIIIADIVTTDNELLKLVRSAKKTTPRTGIIIISDEVPVENKIEILAGGADDYLVRPLQTAELRARVYTLMRRCSMGGVNEIVYNGISIEPSSRRVKCGGKQVVLTRKEYELLFLFLRNPDRVITHEMIAEYLWGDLKSLTADCFDFIHCHIKNVRKKLANAGGQPLISTVYGVGYVIR
ncbi:MAG: response regulator transcription factor [Alistipes sp.]|nr:response regulator transcription factor [Alistipes sp.]